MIKLVKARKDQLIKSGRTKVGTNRRPNEKRKRSLISSSVPGTKSWRATTSHTINHDNKSNTQNLLINKNAHNSQNRPLFSKTSQKTIENINSMSNLNFNDPK